jgi:asparagine synthase (glutamine-hydrolysing)
MKCGRFQWPDKFPPPVYETRFETAPVDRSQVTVRTSPVLFKTRGDSRPRWRFKTQSVSLNLVRAGFTSWRYSNYIKESPVNGGNMCGIAGIMAAALSERDRTILEQVVKSQESRGPDFSSVVSLTSPGVECILGHNRLAIVDVEERSNQPMWNVTRTRCIVYNGEVYNYPELRMELISKGHAFRTNGDTEVILAAFDEWGLGAIERFIGMFAFALFDKEKCALYLVRDRFGVKPLYYAGVNGRVLFASTSTVIARSLNLKPNLRYVAHGAAHWIYEDDGDDTPYEGLRAVPAGSYVTVRIASEDFEVSAKRYYDLEARVEAMQESIALTPTRALRERVLELIEDATLIRTRADVPLGVSLSGGLDSTTIAAVVTGKNAATTGYTFGHPTKATTEARTVARFARHAGIKVEYVWPTARAVEHAFWQTLSAQGAPFAGVSVVAQYLLYQRVRQTGIKVLLGGQGGDEAFMGYRKFHLFRVQSVLRERNWSEGLSALRSFGALLLTELPRVRQNWQVRHRYSGKLKESVLRLPTPAPLAGMPQGLELWRRQARDVTQLSLPTLLRYEDRNSMAHSVESRLPFLDYRVVELGISLPVGLKLNGGYGKAIVRDVFEGRVPTFITRARLKRGFDFGSRSWFDGPLGRAMRGRLAEKWRTLSNFIVPGTKLEEAFSDPILATRESAFVEAVTLLWLAETL